jgi:para-nitrobenzyl esterase
MGTLPPLPLAEAEKVGVKFATAVNANSLAALRAMTVEQLFKETGKEGAARFPAAIDGYFFPQALRQIYAEGKQAHVPLLVGWNSQENPARRVLGDTDPTPENYASAVRKLYPNHAEEAVRVYGAKTAGQVEENATALASDRFIAYSTWIWSNLCEKTGGKSLFRYYYSRSRPSMGNAVAGLAGGVIRGPGPEQLRRHPHGAPSIRPKLNTRWAILPQIRSMRGPKTTSQSPERWKDTSRTSSKPAIRMGRCYRNGRRPTATRAFL